MECFAYLQPQRWSYQEHNEPSPGRVQASPLCAVRLFPGPPGNKTSSWLHLHYNETSILMRSENIYLILSTLLLEGSLWRSLGEVCATKNITHCLVCIRLKWATMRREGPSCQWLHLFHCYRIDFEFEARWLSVPFLVPIYLDIIARKETPEIWNFQRERIRGNAPDVSVRSGNMTSEPRQLLQCLLFLPQRNGICHQLSSVLF